MGALSNSGRKTANLAGFYKGIQSAGAAIFWRLHDLGIEEMTLLGITVSCESISTFCATPQSTN